MNLVLTSMFFCFSFSFGLIGEKIEPNQCKEIVSFNGKEKSLFAFIVLQQNDIAFEIINSNNESKPMNISKNDEIVYIFVTHYNPDTQEIVHEKKIVGCNLGETAEEPNVFIGENNSLKHFFLQYILWGAYNWKPEKIIFMVACAAGMIFFGIFFFFYKIVGCYIVHISSNEMNYTIMRVFCCSLICCCELPAMIVLGCLYSDHLIKKKRKNKPTRVIEKIIDVSPHLEDSEEKRINEIKNPKKEKFKTTVKNEIEIENQTNVVFQETQTQLLYPDIIPLIDESENYSNSPFEVRRNYGSININEEKPFLKVEKPPTIPSKSYKQNDNSKENCMQKD